MSILNKCYIKSKKKKKAKLSSNQAHQSYQTAIFPSSLPTSTNRFTDFKETSNEVGKGTKGNE